MPILAARKLLFSIDSTPEPDRPPCFRMGPAPPSTNGLMLKTLTGDLTLPCLLQHCSCNRVIQMPSTIGDLLESYVESPYSTAAQENDILTMSLSTSSPTSNALISHGWVPNLRSQSTIFGSPTATPTNDTTIRPVITRPRRCSGCLESQILPQGTTSQRKHGNRIA